MIVQDPASGYYRMRRPNYLEGDDITLIGYAEPCKCNGHRFVIDKYTQLIDLLQHDM